MNIAIIIGVSQYNEPDNDLPGCLNDAKLMHKLLTMTGKYKEILLLTDKDDTVSFSLKEKLTSFIEKYSSEKIEEVFFYFTGHGEYFDDEFYYILSDYKEAQRKQTALENAELDNLLRSLKAELSVKVVDACESGVKYVKSTDVFKKYLDNTKASFDKCYFWFSSMSNQSSYQDEIISWFTKSFIDSIVNHKANEIRYKDIMNYISDNFTNNSLQTPFFITQADFTEKFCAISDDIRKIHISSSDSDEEKNTTKKEDKIELSIVDKIKKEAENYFSKEELISKLDLIWVGLESYQHKAELLEIYEFKSYTSDYLSNSPSLSPIGKWINDNGQNKYFAKATYEIKEYQVDDRDYFTSIIRGKKTEYRNELIGYELTITKLPYKSITINANPKHQNIPKFECRIVYIASKQDMVIFVSNIMCEETDWGVFKIDDKSKWTYYQKNLNEINEGANISGLIANNFDEFILSKLHEMYDVKE